MLFLRDFFTYISKNNRVLWFAFGVLFIFSSLKFQNDSIATFILFVYTLFFFSPNLHKKRGTFVGYGCFLFIFYLLRDPDTSLQTGFLVALFVFLYKERSRFDLFYLNTVLRALLLTAFILSRCLLDFNQYK